MVQTQIVAGNRFYDVGWTLEKEVIEGNRNRCTAFPLLSGDHLPDELDFYNPNLHHRLDRVHVKSNFPRSDRSPSWRGEDYVHQWLGDDSWDIYQGDNDNE